MKTQFDYKDWIQHKAEEITQEKYNKDLYDLDNAQQLEVCNEAEEAYKDYYASQINAAYERSKR